MNNVLMQCVEEWKSVEAFDLLIRLVSRVSSRLFVGDDLCRDVMWLKASRGHYGLSCSCFCC